MERIGGWRCLDCSHTSAAIPDPESPATCGQREVMYCPACNALKCHEFTQTSIAPQQRKIPMPTAVGFHPTQQQIDRVRGSLESSSSTQHLAGASSLPTSSGSNSGLSPLFPDSSSFSEMTIEALQDLQKRISAYSDAIVREMSERKLCIVCYTAIKEVIFYPCKHKCLCRQCSEKVSQCPVCRVAIADRILPFDA
ncbi:zinc finger protein, putative [Bodo saltans]|uniref:Zinc finger protein, putative n=1 Tax=Bodo saltans TaxID=75058 RepID=A0A0S4JKJ0_BODSA|nr:zinc finger protein, putative [Bodo saltans]|eukprot:CUG90735.1 zinc finger protein, putative [Bodo saltans]